MADVKFFDLKPGLTLPSLKVRSVALMTNGDVRLYYEESVRDEPIAFPAPSPLAEAQLSQQMRMANDYSVQQRKLERDMASGPGSKKKS